MPGHRNRNGRRGNDPRGTNPQRQSTGPRAGTPNASQARRGAKAGSNMNRSIDSVHNGSARQATPPPEQHVAMAGFNSDAVEAVLRQGLDTKAPVYKPETTPQTTKPESPWGLKPGAMANGKDFWLDLRKQVAALQQTGGTSQGG
ncbi:hypothetical protein A1O1_05363 [Capronia coronata CBS 617.96]|uniref:Uncharacterized protein n=1 Tax=Capronia coronata CBS 617.96 TaxID=1182541 RepID=W9Y7E8_9EURO|nr:uncharacterized protein A1O1_05363 [Capronia coronata CBS 617.96]EXJ88433.1 hypothetical protein A1O1_05363 [Capronia coronata CBS 617.96]